VIEEESRIYGDGVNIAARLGRLRDVPHYIIIIREEPDDAHGILTFVGALGVERRLLIAAARKPGGKNKNDAFNWFCRLDWFGLVLGMSRPV